MVINDIADYICANISGQTKGENVYKAFQPDTPDDCITIIDTGGALPNRYIPTADPSFQVLVRASEYGDAQSLVDSLVDLLHQKVGSTIGSHYYYSIFLLGEPGYIGRDDKDRYEFSMNFIAHIRR